jgi:hypothetical protein
MPKHLLLSFCLLSYCLFTHAQLVKTGDPGINYALIKNARYAYDINIYDTTGKQIQQLYKTDEITIDKEKNLLIRAQQKSFASTYFLIDTTVADLKTLRPIKMWMKTHPFSMDMDLTFNERDVHAIVNRQNLHTDTLHAMEAGYFDSNLVEYVMGLLPYKEGYTALLNAYTFEHNGMSPYKVEYLGKDMIDKARCNLVKVNSGETTWFLWFNETNGIMEKGTIPTPRGMLILERR